MLSSVLDTFTNIITRKIPTFFVILVTLKFKFVNLSIVPIQYDIRYIILRCTVQYSDVTFLYLSM